MKTFIAVLVILSLAVPVPVHAGMVGTPDMVEKGLLDPQGSGDTKADDQKMTDDFQRDMQKNGQPVKRADSSSGSNWWKWALGILVVGGLAAAAGGGGGGGGGGTTPAATGGTVTTTW